MQERRQLGPILTAFALLDELKEMAARDWLPAAAVIASAADEATHESAEKGDAEIADDREAPAEEEPASHDRDDRKQEHGAVRSEPYLQEQEGRGADPEKRASRMSALGCGVGQSRFTVTH